ncbi:MAG: beta-ketoacyl-ACP synthase II [Deferribacteres bacterium]|nr:beta-ketoacyl-ACP synthase II [candidate division KSB1 bacterium]MCB9500570.1 beta-ketoacyl-ACP synthase II [Deferribacteres bacterium]
MQMKRAVITGMGAMTPLALTIEETWQKLVAGESGIDEITLFDTTDHKTKIAGEVKGFNPEDYMDSKEARHMDRFCQLAVAAAGEAVKDAELMSMPQLDIERVAVIVGSGIGGMLTFTEESRKLFERGPRRISPFFIPMMISDIAAGQISMRYGFRGPNYATTSACASSANALADAWRIIQRGESDVVIAGGAEATINELGVGGFNALKALSTRNEEPQKASRPFDQERDGFVMGEGSGMLIIESLEHALQRNAKIYGELAGAGLSADAYHVTMPAPEGYGAQLAMKRCLVNANIQPEEVQYINAHGTSTPANDKNETIAIRKVFGAHADALSVNSTKSMLGHLLGASGVIEAAVILLSMRDGILHPTVNQEIPDPECDLDYIPNKAQKREINISLSNSFGFGGHNACLCLRRFES